VDQFLKEALEEAAKGRAEGGIPIGSVIVYQNQVLGRGEMDALRDAGRQPHSIYRECVLYTTLSPCAMCSGAILLYGIPRVVIGENVTFQGEEELLASRGVTLEVLQDPGCIKLLQDFIKEKPEVWNEDIGR
jgi:creatinine deaminase